MAGRCASCVSVRSRWRKKKKKEEDGGREVYIFIGGEDARVKVGLGRKMNTKRR